MNPIGIGINKPAQITKNDFRGGWYDLHLICINNNKLLNTQFSFI